MGREVAIPLQPKRIISLVPSQTELLSYLGLEDTVVGVTKFCIHPGQLKAEKTIVGGTKNFRFDVIDELKPDLILGNKEENYQEGIELLAEKHPVWMSDIFDLKDALSMIQQVAAICNKEEEGLKVVETVERDIEQLPDFKPLTALYLIWQKPYMAAGRDTFIHEMMELAGFENVLVNDRYPELSEADIKSLNPNVILLSSEPYPFAEKHKEALMQLFPESRVELVDGEMFSWYGSRLLKLPAYLKELREIVKK